MLLGALAISIAFAGPPAAQVQPGNDPPPSLGEQQRLLDRMQTYSARYLANLPNFVCEQVVHQFEGGRKAGRWKRGDTLTSKLVFSQGREDRTLELVNDKAINRGRSLRRPLITEGEFGILLANVLDRASAAHISWSRWDEIRHKRLAVFDYVIDQQHSTLSLSLSDLASTIVPYRGSIFADPATGVVWRITNSAFDIPEKVETKSIATTVDYGEVLIAGQNYFLPVESTVNMNTGSRNIMNQTEFLGYRKFETDSKIIFAATDPGTPAKPPDSSSGH